jgi:hypothetical protein
MVRHYKEETVKEFMATVVEVVGMVEVRILTLVAGLQVEEEAVILEI